MANKNDYGHCSICDSLQKIDAVSLADNGAELDLRCGHTVPVTEKTYCPLTPSHKHAWTRVTPSDKLPDVSIKQCGGCRTVDGEAFLRTLEYWADNLRVQPMFMSTMCGSCGDMQVLEQVGKIKTRFRPHENRRTGEPCHAEGDNLK